MIWSKKKLFVILFLIFFTALFSQDLKKLSDRQVVMTATGGIYNVLPQFDNWADDSHYYLETGNQLWLVDAVDGKRTEILNLGKYGTLDEKKFKISDAVHFTPNYWNMLFDTGEAFLLFSRKDGTLVQFPKKNETAKPYKNPTISPDGQCIAYSRNGNLFVMGKEQKKEIQLTTDGGGSILNGYASWVYYEEILGRASNYKAYWWSPDSKHIAFMRFDESKVPVFSIYNEAGEYGSLENTHYPKPGFPNPTVKLGIIELSSGKTQWVPVDDPNEYYLALPVWDKTGTKLYFQWMNRDQDHLKVYRFDLNSGKMNALYDETQTAWVELFEENDFKVLSNGDMAIRSSKSGWFHLYYIPVNGPARQLTSGDWSVTKIVCVDEKNNSIYFEAEKEDSTENQFYRMDMKGNSIKKLTDFKGYHTITMFPGGRYFFDDYSAVNSPQRIDLRDINGKFIRNLGDASSPELEKYNLSKGELFRIKTEDGFALPAVWYLPPNMDKTKKYPVVITIYGGPNSPIVKNSYGPGYRRGLEKFYLAQEGIINLFVDNRSSGHFGKKGMDMVHRQLGKWELHDYIEVVKYLRTLPFVNSEKIGIKGHSYGGFMAAYAITNGADYFKYAISASPVIDWRLYDSVYTERFMDTPQQNPEGYNNSSTLTYIDKFNGVLRMTHGTMDDNVHLQNALQFLNKALDKEKTLELMIYPGNRHGIRGGKGIENKLSDIHFWFKHFLGRQVD